MKYNSSETMRFLGKQYYNLMLTQEQYNQLQDIKKAGLEDNEFNLEMMLADAYILGFIHPVSGEYIETTAPIPEYFNAILDKLRKK